MDPDFNIADVASMPAIEKFKITDKVLDSAGAFAATMLGMASLFDGTFRETKSIVVDHENAKTMLPRLRGCWLAGMLLARQANADRVAATVGSTLEKLDIKCI